MYESCENSAWTSATNTFWCLKKEIKILISRVYRTMEISCIIVYNIIKILTLYLKKEDCQRKTLFPDSLRLWPEREKINLPSNNGDEVELFWLWKQKMVDISLVSGVRNRRKNSWKHGKNSKKTTRRATLICYLENICRAACTNLPTYLAALSKMNLTLMDRWR